MHKRTPFYLFLLLMLTVSSNNGSLQSYSLPEETNNTELELFCTPIRFTRSGIHYFLKNIFNHPLYATEYLPHNFSHFIQFIQDGKRNKQPRSYMEAAIRLFMNKMKSCRYISAYAFDEMLDHAPYILKEYCIITQQESFFTKATKAIKDTLYQFFMNKFAYFKEDPDSFFDDMTKAMSNGFEADVQTHIECEEVRQMMIRFLEIGLTKLVWSPHDQLDTWQSAKEIAQKLALLHEHDMINQDELDDLYRTLLESYCHFLDIAGSELSLHTLNTIRDEIAAGGIPLIDLEEQEEVLQSKANRLQLSLVETEAKVRARLQGIITGHVIVS